MNPLSHREQWKRDKKSLELKNRRLTKRTNARRALEDIAIEKSIYSFESELESLIKECAA